MISGTQKTPTPNHRGLLGEPSPTVKVLGVEPSPQLSLSSQEASLCSSLLSLRRQDVPSQGLRGLGLWWGVLQHASGRSSVNTDKQLNLKGDIAPAEGWPQAGG